ncbi:MAG: glycine cleavage system protein GcvH [Opitutales bacterium]|nr:glycine cleavage system protein GcvH [Opitutales bacterium]
MKRFTQDHEWLEIDEDGIGTVGISEYAQETLGEITKIEMPGEDAFFKKGEAFAHIESENASCEVYMPASGKIIAINEQLEAFPELLNSEPEGVGWIVKIELSDKNELNELIKKEDYLETLPEEESEDEE